MVESPLKYIGGKAASKGRIVAAFPDPESYQIYVEPCGGAGSVLLHRAVHPRHTEIYNDLDSNVVAYWREMQRNGAGLRQRLEAHLYSIDLYYEYYHSLFDGTPLSQEERALRFFYVLRGTGTGWVRESPVGWNAFGTKGFRSRLTLFEAVQKRLERVAIDNRDALETIERFDSPQTLFYVDPPYMGREWYYECSKKGFPHEELAALLQTVKGKVALSYYPHPNLLKWYPSDRWATVTWQQQVNSHIQLKNKTEQHVATELILCNYALPPQSLWDMQNPNGEEDEVA